MSLKARVKVGHITNLSEARYCAGMGVDFLGFPVGEGGLQPDQYRQMIEWVAGPELVLEVHHSRAMDLQYITDNYPGHYIEIGLSQLDWLSRTDLNFVVAMQTGDWVSLYGDLMGKSNIKYIELTDATKNDAGTIRGISAIFPVLLHVASPDDLADILKMNAGGVALMGSEEEKPGINTYGKTADILEALDEDA